MGFYGNITNTIKTNLSFDRKYSNRFQMETNCSSDGVYAGRYILIEYDLTWDNTGWTNNMFSILYEGYIDGKLVQSTSPSLDIVFTPDLDVIYRVVEVENVATGLSIYTNKYYIGVKDEMSDRIVLKLATNSDSAYVTNFNIDTNYYGDSRGWDSTVWVKSYDTNGIPKYVMVAELNSIVPTFAISVDAPTEIPQSPHFDESNTNIFYTLHLQPQWGLQLKAAENSAASDVTINRTFNTYDVNNTIIDTEVRSTPLNIYYNKAGFSPEQQVVSGIKDKVALENTGKSGKYYNDPSHEPGTAVTPNQIDTYEFSLLIPSLGNAVSSMWDAVYEVGDNAIRKRDIAWKDAFEKDTEDTSKGGLSVNVNTLAGTINAAHKLMGMIITTTDDIEDIYANNYIYENNGKYYRVIADPQYEVVTEFIEGQKYYIKKTDESGVVYYEVANHNVPDQEYYALAKTELKYVELLNFGDTITTMNGLLLKMANMLDLNNKHSIDTNTVQGALNLLNSIIDVFGDLKPQEFAIINNEGKIVSAGWTTAQQMTYTDGFETNEKIVDNEKVENRWITLSVDPSTRLITVLHTLAYNQIQGQEIETNFETDESTINTFNLYTPLVDNAGHIIGHNKEKVILPNSIRSFTTNGVNTNEDDLGAAVDQNYSYSAQNVRDNFGINVGNKWLESKINDNILTVAHSTYQIDKTKASDTNLNGDTEGADNNTLVLQDINHDAAGHITENKNHSYILPYSYKYLKTNGSAMDKTTDLITNNPNNPSEKVYPGITSANALKGSDNLFIQIKNKWLQSALSSSENGNTVIDLAHTISNIETPDPQSVALSNTSSSFSIVKDNFDAAGHIIKKEETTYTLGNNYSYITVKNNQEENGQIITPRAPYENLNITLDPWLIGGTNTIDGSIGLTINHGAPRNEYGKEINIINEDQPISLIFGSAIDIPYFGYDLKGHIYTAGINQFTLPLLSTEDTGDGNVLISSFIDINDNGKMIFNKNHLGSLKLSSYYTNVDDDKIPSYSAILSTDTLQQAIGKLESGYLSNANKLEILQGSQDGSISQMINDAILEVTGGNETTIQVLSDSLSNKLDSNKEYTITSTDGTVILKGNLESILQQLLDRTIISSTENGSETA